MSSSKKCDTSNKPVVATSNLSGFKKIWSSNIPNRNWNVIKQKHGFNQSHNGRTDAKVGLKQPDSLSFKTLFQKRLRNALRILRKKCPFFFVDGHPPIYYFYINLPSIMCHQKNVNFPVPGTKRQPLGGSSSDTIGTGTCHVTLLSPLTGLSPRTGL